MPVLESVNTALPERLEGHQGLTGIFKRPREGAVEIRPLGLIGDAVIDTRYHGGPDQAVYVYLASDYAWWERQWGTALAPGTFGENLTIAGLAADLSVGDRFAIGEVLIEITSHRGPCNTLARRMGDAKFVKRFMQSGRPGAYCRVLKAGMVEAGMDVGYTQFPGVPVRVAELMALEGVRQIEEGVLRRALAAPIHFKMRADFEARLSKISAIQRP